MIWKLFHLFTIAVCAHCQFTPSETYARSATLDSGNLILYWKFTETHITIEVQGRAGGWVGIGFSPNGAMTGADIFVGWVSDGSVTVTDRHGLANAFPPKDPKQDIEVLAGRESNGWTMFKFTRELAACESEYDREITSDTQRLIWAFGESDPTGDDIITGDYHNSHRGVKSIIFLDSTDRSQQLPVGPEYHTFDAGNMNFSVPAITSYYNCILYRLPELSEKHHIVKYEPLIQAGHEMIVHHIIISLCAVTQDASEVGQDRPCATGLLRTFRDCLTIFAGWSIGSGATFYPEAAGYPFGSPGDRTIILIETHYDNPESRADIIDSSGLRFTYTNTLRQYDAGIMEVGNIVNGMMHFMPPGAQSFLSSGYCSVGCLEKRMNVSGITEINVFSALLHSHKAGRAMNLRHYRDGVEQPYISNDEHYDFNFQQNRQISPEVQVRSGDLLRMDCVYNTEDSSIMVQGGQPTSQEMCMAFIAHYPKVDISYCSSAAYQPSSYGYFGIQTYNQESSDWRLEDITVTEPANLANKSVLDVMNEYNWNEESSDEFAVALFKMPQVQICLTGKRSESEITVGLFPNITSVYTPPVKSCIQPTTVSVSTVPTEVQETVTCGSPLSTTCNILPLLLALLVINYFQPN